MRRRGRGVGVPRAPLLLCRQAALSSRGTESACWREALRARWGEGDGRNEPPEIFTETAAVGNGRGFTAVATPPGRGQEATGPAVRHRLCSPDFPFGGRGLGSCRCNGRGVTWFWNFNPRVGTGKKSLMYHPFSSPSQPPPPPPPADARANHSCILGLYAGRAKCEYTFARTQARGLSHTMCAGLRLYECGKNGPVRGPPADWAPPDLPPTVVSHMVSSLCYSRKTSALPWAQGTRNVNCRVEGIGLQGGGRDQREPPLKMHRKSCRNHRRNSTLPPQA